MNLPLLKQACEKATPGPWKYTRIGDYEDHSDTISGGYLGASVVADAFSKANGEYIALCSPDTVKALIACAEALKELEGLVRSLAGDVGTHREHLIWGALDSAYAALRAVEGGS